MNAIWKCPARERGESMSQKTGWYTWLHHDIPIEWTDNLDERLRYIEENKPAQEQAIRLAAIVAVPEARVPREFVKAGRVYAKARRVYNEAMCVDNEVRRVSEAWQASAGRAYVRAGLAAQDQLLALAREFAPEAPVRGSHLVFPVYVP